MTNLSSEISQPQATSNTRNAYTNILQEQIYYIVIYHIIYEYKIHIFKKKTECLHSSQITNAFSVAL